MRPTSSAASTWCASAARIPNLCAMPSPIKEVIDRFGRFPHRNAILGRPNTPEEEDYLKDPDAGF